MRQFNVFFLVILFSLSASANANQFTRLDTNNDGRISIKEASKDAALASVFSELDINKDGFLVLSELTH